MILREDIPKKVFPLFIVLLLSMAAAAAVRPSEAVVSNPTGLIIPLYTTPIDGTWARVLNAKNAHPSVPMTVVVNPNNGPGAAQDPSYVQGIKDFQIAGIAVLGYVATGYGSNPLTSMKSQVLAYRNWYQMNGVMFDEMGNALGQELYYSALNDYAKLLGMTFTMGNPGIAVPLSFIGTLDALDIYENPGYPSIATLSQYAAYSKTDFSMIAFSVPLDISFIRAASQYVSWLWLSNDALPNPYDSLPSYFSDEVAALDVSVPAGSTSTLTVTQTSMVTSATTVFLTATTTVVQTKTVYSKPQFFVAVASSDLSRKQFSGMYLTVGWNGTDWKSGFTTFFFVASYGDSYQVCVFDYQTTTFSHWEDGSTTSCRMLYPTGSTLIVAFYNT